MDVVDVTNWDVDREHEIFPVGARDKVMLWSPNEEISSQVKTNWPHLFKESTRSCPEQFWAEIISFQIAVQIGIDVPIALPAIRLVDGNIVCGALISWFYDPESERYVHAQDFFQQINPDFDSKRGTQHNLVDMITICRLLKMNADLQTDYKQWLADMALFDAFIGNTDRHQENWGVIFKVNHCILSPLFDNGTSLGFDKPVTRTAQWNDEKFSTYIHNGHHHLRGKRETPNERIPLFKLIEMLKIAESDMERLNDKFAQIDLHVISTQIESLTHIDIPQRLSNERYNWIMRNINYRYKSLSGILGQ